MSARMIHIKSFQNWVRLYENMESDQEQEITKQVDLLCQDFERVASMDRLKTSDLMNWFHGMLEIYDSTSLKILVFRKMKSIFAKYFKQIFPILDVNNRELTSRDISEIKRYKQITQDESQYERSAEDMLKDLGLI